jgi:hypothetical protein
MLNPFAAFALIRAFSARHCLAAMAAGVCAALVLTGAGSRVQAAQTIEAAESSAQPELSAETDSGERLLREQQVAAMSRLLDDYRNTLGPYAPELMEVQQDLSRELLALERYAEAAAVLTEALQLARVTDGLYSERQLEILENLRNAHLGLQDWKQVDDYQHLKFQLQSRYYQPDSTDYADALIERASWILQASRLNLLGRPGSNSVMQELLEMNAMHAQALEAARQREDPLQQWELLSAVAMTEIEIARQYNHQEINEMMMATPRYVNQTVCRMVSDGAGGAQRVCWQERVQNPEYNRYIANHRRMNLERGRVNVQSSQRQMDAFLQANPEFAITHPERVGPRMDSIRQAIEELQRSIRRVPARDW